MYEALVKKFHKTMAEAQFEMSRCNDTYRLAKILHDTTYRFDAMLDEANDMVRELEHGE
jgi:hypothetical protein